MGNDKELLTDEKKLNKFLTEQKEKNSKLIRKYYPQIKSEDIEDVYQEACLAMFINIKSNKLEEFVSTRHEGVVPKASTYFSRICLSQAGKFWRGDSKRDSLDEIIEQHSHKLKFHQEGDDNDNDVDFDDGLVNSLIDGATDDAKETTMVMRELVKQLPSPCEQILWYYYGKEKLSLADIAEEINFKTANAVKARKSQCMSRLKEKVSYLTGVVKGRLKEDPNTCITKLIDSYMDINTDSHE